jgi:serine phosphatase RsbU (regulator of sigma subunit)/tetratricopeptide (TPR) repeat protein/predicted Ser/Thr protein kinase
VTGTTPWVERSSTVNPPDRIGDFTIERELGRGAMSVVYAALRGQERFAVKVMFPRAETSHRLQFRREAAALARIDHPGVVRVVEAGEIAARSYLVMAFAPGRHLEARISEGAFDDATTLSIATQVAQALAEVHRLGMVHRDIKPANIMVDDAGHARLIDFGLVADETSDDQFAGTLGYAAPEQLGVLNRACSPASDLYALGATLFQCLTGQPPHQATSEANHLHWLATSPAPDVRDLRPGTGPALARILRRLLAKDPDDRYQSAAGLLADLQRIDELDAAIAAGLDVQLNTDMGGLFAMDTTPFVGHEKALASVQGCWDRGRGRTLTFVQVRGEGGSGKTRLARELIARAQDTPMLVLAGKCQESEGTPFGPLREIADRLAAHIHRLDESDADAEIARVQQAAGDGAPLIGRLSSSLAAMLGHPREVRVLEPGAEQQRFYQTIATFLLGLASADRPVLLLLDDVQWLDEGSLRVFEALAQHGEGTPMLVLATRRPIDNPTVATYERATAVHAAPTVDLGPLAPDDVAELIRAQLGGRPLDGVSVAKLTALTEGAPFALQEYLRALMERGVVRPREDSWFIDPDDFDSVGLPGDLVQLLVRRLDALTAELSPLVRTAAMLGGRFSVRLVAGICGMNASEALAALVRLRRLGLLEISFDGSWSFHHDRVREAVAERVTEDAQRALHQAIAEAYEAQPDGSPTRLYAIAKHLGLGEVDRDPGRVLDANLAAGLAALEEHAYEDAYDMLELAHALWVDLGQPDANASVLLAALGRAAVMTGRLDEAFVHLEAALEHADNRDALFNLHYLLTLTYASQGRNEEALAALYESFDVLGKPLPTNGFVQALVLLYTWGLALFLRWTGIGHDSAEGAEREHRLVVSRLNYAGTMIALFEGNTFGMVQFIVRDFHNSHYLGASAETAIASSVYGAVLGTFQLRNVMDRHTRAGVEMAEQLGDQAALSVCHAYQSMGHKWSGELDRGNEMLLRCLPDLNQYVPGSWYAAMMICEQAYSFMHEGRAREAAEHIRVNLPHLRRTNNLMFQYNTLSVAYMSYALRGRFREAEALWADLEPRYEAMSDNAYVKLARCIALLEVAVDRGDADVIDDIIAEYWSVLGEDYYTAYARMLIGYARVVQVEAADEADRPTALRKLRKATRSHGLRAMVPVFCSHTHIWRAVDARHSGNLRLAKAELNKATTLSQRQASDPRARYEIAVERARIAQAAGDATASYFAQQAVEIARSEDWRLRGQRIVREFGLQEQRADREDIRASRLVSRSDEQARRYADALLQVSLASASSLDGKVQAKHALEAVARVLHAERAVFYRVDGDGTPTLESATGHGAGTVSNTVVNHVVQSREPVVITGDDAGNNLGSESILTFGLRSIMAAPITLRDRLLGVVYVDSRVAKAMFTDDDVQLLTGLANHIAIALDTARAARLEAERSVMERDLELVGAVQSMMLPSQPRVRCPGIVAQGYYQPAAQCGGDWWWYETHADGSLSLWMGDVSGHGAAPAMVTSTVAGAFHTLRRLQPDMPVPRVLAELHEHVARLGGDFHMTMTAVHVDGSRVQVWNAGGPGVMLQRDRDVRVLVRPGCVLGTPGAFEVGYLAESLQQGDRLLLATDGLLELESRNGRVLGARGVSRMLRSHVEREFDDVGPALLAELQTLLTDTEQLDDITFICLELDALSAPAPMGSQ